MVRKRKEVWAPSAADFVEVVAEQNPWKNSGQVPEVWAPQAERSLAKGLWKRLRDDKPRRFQLILGPRRVGKTTSMYQTVRHLLAAGVPRDDLWWLRLDHPILMSLPLNELVKSIINQGTRKPRGRRPIYLFLDELTYAKEWDLWLKTFYDDNWPIRIAGSSSSTAALRDRKLESGVGRWEEQYLAPYLFSEYLDLIGSAAAAPVKATLHRTLKACVDADLDLSGLPERRRRFLLTGGFPELLIAAKDHATDEASALLQSQRTLRNDAVERAIYKDIPQVFGVDSPLLLERLLYTLAGQVTGLLSPNSICQSLDNLSQPTFDRYLSYLTQAFLVFTLPNFSGSEAARQKRGRRLYFVDGAVRNAALQRGIAPLKNDDEIGLLIENMAAGHLHALGQQSQVRLYHWRDKQDEVDLIFDHPEEPLAFEITTGKGHHRRGLLAFAERFPRFQGRCFLVGPHETARMPRPDAIDDIGTLPLDLFFVAVSAQAQRELEKNLMS